MAHLLCCVVPVIAFVLASACQRSRPVAPIHLEAVRGNVAVRAHDANADVPGHNDQALTEGDVVTTGVDAETDVVFTGNNRVHLGPNGALLLSAAGSTSTQLGAIVLSGVARAQGGGEGIGLSIGTPLGTARLSGNKFTVLEIDLGRGLHLTTGEVNLVRPDRLEMLPLVLGQTLEVGALPILLPSQQMVDVPGLTVQSLAPTPPPPPARAAHLRARSGQVARQAGGTGAWLAAASGDAIGVGDLLRLGADGSAELALADDMDVALRGRSELGLGAYRETDGAGGLRAHYSLRRGNAQLHIAGNADGGPAAGGQEVEVAGVTLQVAPGAREARVEVQNARPRRARVVVRYGRVRVGNLEVEAGQAVDVVDGRPSAVQQAFVAPVQLEPGRPAVLFTQDGVPALRFGADAPGTHHVELADGADMAALRNVENTRAAALATDEVPMGTSYWRNGAGPAARLDVRAEPRRSCARCAREEAIDDTGEVSEVVYQSEPPTLRLRWSAVPEAHGYRVRISDAAAPKSEMLVRTCTETELRLRPGELGRGTYLWSVTPVDEAGETLATAKDNTLRLSLDNVAQGLNVRYPQGGVQVKRRQLVTSGEVERGSTLKLNGRAVRLDDVGAFRERVALRPGLNRLVFTVSRVNEPDRIYVRDVTRAGPRPVRAAAPTLAAPAVAPAP